MDDGMEQLEQSPGTRFFDRVWELLLLNFCWCLGCLPLFTIGASTAAAYAVAFRWQKGELVPVWSGYWGAFRENFRQGVLAQLLQFLLLGAGAAFLQAGEMFPIMKGFFTALGVVVLAGAFFSFLLVYPILAKFELSLREAFANAVFLLSRHTLPVMGAALTLTIGACFVFFLAPPLMLVMGGLVIYLNSITLGHIFEKIIKSGKQGAAEEKNG